jgi:hypothetical protein
LMCLLIALFFLNNYSALPYWERVTDEQLKGTEFFALKVKPHERYFYISGGQVILYHDPNLLKSLQYNPLSLNVWPGNLAALDGLRYVIIDKQANSKAKLLRGDNPYAAWPQTEAGQVADFIYDNGDFQIYRNYLVE